MDEFIDVEYQM